MQDLKKAQEFIQFEIDAIEAWRANAVMPKAPQHPNCRCSVKPKVSVIGLEVPADATPEQIIHMAIKKIYGGE